MKRDLLFIACMTLSAGCQYVPVHEHALEQEYQARQEFAPPQAERPQMRPEVNPEDPAKSGESRAEYRPVKIERSQNHKPNKKEQPKAMKPDTDEFSYTVLNDTPYYSAGPQQAGPPDGSFVKGTKLKVIKNAGSYSLVKSSDGIEAYVAVDDIKKVD